MKSWTVGQKVVCDRQDRQLSGCIVRSVNSDSIVIFCPKFNTVICGLRKNLEKLGWRILG
ncbi:MAG: hypothetical protein WCA35_29315 [Kovacikia sp.]